MLCIVLIHSYIPVKFEKIQDRDFTLLNEDDDEYYKFILTI